MLAGFLATAVPLALECGGTLPSLKPELAPPVLTAGTLGIERPGQGLRVAWPVIDRKAERGASELIFANGRFLRGQAG
ncbi:hypothetical protein [Amycolatopsis sp. NPDC059657]|uniref:hypothetical protein n=1 Tax=Amycolatopsis sp. NPDC059657 TaxID=3346899 RepID=UPI00367245DD